MSTPPAAASGGELARVGADDDDQDEIRTYRSRWGMLALFCLATASNAVLWITFAPVNTPTQAFYGVNSAKVNALSIVFMAAYVPFSLVSSWVFERFGTRKGLLLACTLNVVSGLIRFLSAKSNEAPRAGGYELLLVGQAFGAIAQPFFTNIPAKIGSLWFPIAERDLAVALGALFNPVGIAVGSVVPTFFVGADEVSIRMHDLLLIELILVAVVLLLVLALFRERPPLPPSLSESHRAEGAPHSLREAGALLVRNRNFVLLAVAFGCGLGFFNALTTLVEQLIAKSGYDTDDAGLFSGLLIGCGILSAIAVGICMDRTHRYNELLKGGFALSGVLILALVLALRPDNSAALCAIFALLGAAMLPMLPVAFECGVECTYPVSEDISSGVLMSVGQITGIAFIVGLQTLLDAQEPFGNAYVFEPAYILIVVASVFFVVGIMFYRGPYARMAAEKERSGHLASV